MGEALLLCGESPSAVGTPASYALVQLSVKIFAALNLPFAEWTEVLGSERLTGALLDRLTHHVHILEMNGESYRLKNSRKKKDSGP